MLDPLGSNQPVRELFDRRCLALEHDDFQAVVVGEVNVQRGNDHPGKIVLEFGECLLDVRSVVVIDERDVPAAS